MSTHSPLPIDHQSPTRSSFFLANDESCPSRWAFSVPLKPESVDHAMPLLIPRALPSTATEWKRALADVKREYINRKYRSCYTRCHEILDQVKDLAKVEAAYLIYLRFYAASAIEMQVRTLQHTSPYRAKLLLQARDHYRLASGLAAEEDASLRRPSSRSLSPVPSLHSPLGSDLTHSTASTRMSSPAPSLSSLDGCMKSLETVTPKPKKRVTFCDVPLYEPVIRPDSPTLGFDDWCSRQPTPEPIIAPPEPPRLIRSAEKPLPAPEFRPEENMNPVDHFLRARSIHHYCTVLNSLQRQIASHLVWLERDIAATLDPQPQQAFTEQMRTLELRTRIERLRANGWKRQRFDAQRYQALRERALADTN